MHVNPIEQAGYLLTGGIAVGGGALLILLRDRATERYNLALVRHRQQQERMYERSLGPPDSVSVAMVATTGAWAIAFGLFAVVLAFSYGHYPPITLLIGNVAIAAVAATVLWRQSRRHRDQMQRRERQRVPSHRARRLMTAYAVVSGLVALGIAVFLVLR